jgi:hypothetical protein
LRYREVCDRFRAEFVSSPERYGHTSGDMLAVGQAVAWGARLGLRTVTKLSHRLVIDSDDWVREDAERLIASGYGTCTQLLTNHGIDQIRSEGIMMVVSRWATPEVAHFYRPRRLATWNETYSFHAIFRYVDPALPYPGFLPWRRLSPIRGRDAPPVYFRSMNGSPLAHFRGLALRHGIELSDDFSIADSMLSDEYQR